MINRSIVPSSKEIEQIKLIEAAKSELSNGIPVYTINTGSQQLIKIEILLNAGSVNEHKAITARATNSLLKEGTKNHSSSQIAEQFDFYGAFLETDCSKDSACIALYSLNKHLSNVLPLLSEIMYEAVFPQNEIEVYLQNSHQHFLVNNQKVDVIARNHFAEIIFGENKYGYRTKEEDYTNLKQDDIKAFHKSYYLNNSPTIILSGLIDDTVHTQLDSLFGKSAKTKKQQHAGIQTVSSLQQKHHIDKADAVQTAIRIGRLLFNKTHPDYFGMLILNSLLGGYFGSRLMSNIREDKGYTYGIGSGVVSMKQTGYFVISTEVGVDVTNDAFKEIYYEIKRLREELVSEEELYLVKNYLLGTFIRSADGPFELANKFKGIYEYGLDYNYYTQYIESIKAISSKRLNELANTYLQEKDLVELTVGKNN